MGRPGQFSEASHLGNFGRPGQFSEASHLGGVGRPGQYSEKRRILKAWDVRDSFL